MLNYGSRTEESALNGWRDLIAVDTIITRLQYTSQLSIGVETRMEANAVKKKMAQY